ncbi:hypothetical protein Vadar_013673 [Vaccinium darrowii]|uniref:Uncharacterized protein n=1 Tax=Vaccinium darrowii TaxID=229202 RepID=A0ACB7XQI1_9ERIC|nr:hypothetical protein Vadar_013673 [Vaccinium darrowii]
MPAAPVPATQVRDWLLQNIASALEHISERFSAKENGPPSSSDQDVPMTDACATSMKPSTSARGSSFIEGISKSSCLKQASDLQGSSVKVGNCHDSVIYILAPLRYATICGCSDATIVLGAVGKLVRSNSRRFMPSESDDEAHQLSYLQKHLANIISLLADSVEGKSE